MLVSAQVNSVFNAAALANTGCDSYSLVSGRAAQKLGTQWIELESPRRLRGFNGPRVFDITHLAKFEMRIGGNYQRVVYAYIVPSLDGEDIILGLAWMKLTILPAWFPTERTPFYAFAMAAR